MSNDWPTIGLDYAETRFSKLNQINADNVKKLGLVWSYPLESSAASRRRRSWSTASCIRPPPGAWCMPSTPAPASSSGPTIPRSTGRRATRAAATSSIAASRSGRARCLSAPMTAGCSRSTPSPARWSGKRTRSSTKDHSYTITGAPRVFNGKVVIGNGGAEYGARGYVTAYDAETGNQAWRWFTVPGDPSKPFEDESMAAAAKTWDPAGKYWINGGGGTAWDTITFDPDLNLVYIGTGNGSPWNRKHPQPVRRRQSLSLLARRAERRHRKIHLALSGDARRSLGLHLDPADDPGRHHTSTARRAR